MKLLVIEDEPSLLQSIMEYFIQIDFLCEGVTTYSNAIQKIDDYTYDCIILDINLPDGSGFELLKYLREYKKDEGVVIISARNSLDDKITGLNFGADDYVTKPFHLSELNARIKALIRRKYAHGSNILEAGNLQMDLAARTVTCENQILAFLWLNGGGIRIKPAGSEPLSEPGVRNPPVLPSRRVFCKIVEVHEMAGDATVARRVSLELSGFVRKLYHVAICSGRHDH